MPFPLQPPDAPGDAEGNQILRSTLLAVLPSGVNQYPSSPEDATAQVLGDLATSFNRFAGNQRTTFDDGGTPTSTNGGANGLESKIRRAWTQVLGRAPGSGASFAQALASAFPATPNGNGVATLPARSIVPTYSPDGMGATMANVTGNYGGQLSVGQAALFRQASVVAADALRVLAGLTTTAPSADLEQMEAARALIGTQITSLVQEFGRVDEPREARVTAYFTALGMPAPPAAVAQPGSLVDFGAAAVYNTPTWVTTETDAAQLAGYGLLCTYVQNLLTAWNAYRPTALLGSPADPLQFSLRLERAQILLPSVGQANSFVRQAWASVGFSESDQRSVANRFDRLVAAAGQPPTAASIYATMTPGDLADWIDSYNDDGLTTLSGSGTYGLEFVTNQADSIFWVVGAVIYTAELETPVGQPSLLQYLDNERVTWALVNLLTQLDGLADLNIKLPL